MKAIVLARRKGKTTRMLAWLLGDTRRVLVVMSARERDRLRKVLTEYGQELDHESQRVVSVDEITSGRTRGLWRQPIYGVDELELVLSQLLNGPVAVVSFTGELES